jgi:N-acetylneuraminic acid mutarotase
VLNLRILPTEVTSASFTPHLPTVVRKGLVGFRHAMRLFTLLGSATTAFRSLEQLGSQRMASAIRRPGRTSTGTW